MNTMGIYPANELPNGVRSRFVEDVNGLTMHVLESGFEDDVRPALLLLHGFPELAYSWRKIMIPLAAAGYHVIAPDQRGYGRTTGWDADYEGDLGSFRFLNLVQDAVALLSALGKRKVNAVIGHDFGSSVASQHPHSPHPGDRSGGVHWPPPKILNGPYRSPYLRVTLHEVWNVMDFPPLMKKVDSAEKEPLTVKISPSLTVAENDGELPPPPIQPPIARSGSSTTSFSSLFLRYWLEEIVADAG